jgi:Domain of unknown function (DUF4276)
MARLLVHVEGQTEETFVNEVLRPHLLNAGYSDVSARIVGNARLRERRGGIRPWPSVREDILKHLRHDITCIATTMVDFYGLPKSGNRAWPGRAEAVLSDTGQKASIVESALLADIAQAMGTSFYPVRFVPFVVMHEFEGLLFSDCALFANGIGQLHKENSFRDIRNGFQTPEDINDSPITAPSKRILALIPEYEKPLFGALAALDIGLTAIRNECPHFNEWLDKLETLSDQQ